MLKVSKKVKQICPIVSIITIPILLGILVSILINHIIKNTGYKLDECTTMDVIKTVLSIWGTLLGFIITTASILVSFSGSKRTEEIKQTRHYKNILFTHLLTCCNLLICLFIFIPVMIINKINMLIFNLFVALLVITLINVGICIFYLALMMISVFKT